MLKRMNKIDLLITHKNCADGTGAALAVLKYCEEVGYRPEIFRAQYGCEVPDVKGMNVLMVDFSFKREILEELNRDAKLLHVLDHHKTSEEDLKGLDYCHFDGTHSGAVLAWNYLYPEAEVPPLLQYIEDRDIWNWNLDMSREFSAGFALTTQSDYLKLDKYSLEELFKYKFIRDSIDAGKHNRGHEEHYVAKKAKAGLKAEFIEIDGVLVPCFGNLLL